jgi:hypothetical protein
VDQMKDVLKLDYIYIYIENFINWFSFVLVNIILYIQFVKNTSTSFFFPLIRGVVAKKKGSYGNKRRIHHLMWTLASMFYKSVSHPLTAFHFQNSNCFLLSLIPQWFTNWQTHRHNNSMTHTSYHVLPHWCDFKRNFSFSFTKYVHPRQLKQFLPSAVHKKKEKSLIVSPCNVLPLPNSSCLFLQQELNSTSDAAENFQYS